MFKLCIFLGLVLIGCIGQMLHARQIEITPFTGWGLGGKFKDVMSDTTLDVDDASNIGVIVNIGDVPESQIELFFSRQETQLEADGTFSSSSLFDLDVDYYHIGGLVTQDGNRWNPFLVGTVGMTYLDPKPSGYDSEAFFSMSVGGGVKTFMTERIGVRLEARALASVVKSSTSVFCGNGSCLIHFRGDLFWQLQFNAGLIFLLQ